MGSALVAAEPADFVYLRDAIHQGETLFAYAATRSQAQPLSGRGAAYRLQTPRGEWVVKRSRRGGAVAAVLGDRYLRSGEPRALRELRVSAAARARGVRTPRVVAAVLYASRFFMRSDLATEYVPLSVDLAEVAFGAADQPSALKAAAFEAAGRLVRQLAEAGLAHPDLNLKNLLIDFEQPKPRAWVLDLDRAHIGKADGNAMWERLQRSIAKWEGIQGTTLNREYAQALSAGFHG